MGIVIMMIVAIILPLLSQQNKDVDADKCIHIN